MITLTLRSSEEGLKERADHLTASFRRLRMCQAWKAYVNGGIAVIETTRGSDGAHWHVHLHVLADGQFFPHHELKEAWKKASGGSEIVHLQAIYSRQGAARYVAKYVGKPFEASTLNHDEIVEYARAMHGRRLVIAFGSLHGSKIEHDEEETPAALQDRIISFDRLSFYADAGDADARFACDVLCRAGPLFRAALGFLPFGQEEAAKCKVSDSEMKAALRAAESVAQRMNGPPPMAESESPSPQACEGQGRLFDTDPLTSYGRL